MAGVFAREADCNHFLILPDGPELFYGQLNTIPMASWGLEFALEGASKIDAHVSSFMRRILQDFLLFDSSFVGAA
jgi:hypothetical protein